MVHPDGKAPRVVMVTVFSRTVCGHKGGEFTADFLNFEDGREFIRVVVDSKTATTASAHQSGAAAADEDDAEHRARAGGRKKGACNNKLTASI